VQTRSPQAGRRTVYARFIAVTSAENICRDCDPLQAIGI
jgi:hypothetical protein